MKFFLLIIFSLLVINPGLAISQDNILGDLNLQTDQKSADFKSADEVVGENYGLADQFLNFQKQKNDFFSNQTTVNKILLDEASGPWAVSLIAAQRDRLDQIEVELNFLSSQENEKLVDYFSAERKKLLELESEAGTAKTYAAASSIISSASDLWQNVLEKINQIRVWQIYDRFYNLVDQSEKISLEIKKSQEKILDNMIAEEASVWNEWELLFETYNQAVSDFRLSLEAVTGDFSQQENFFNFDENDSVWQEKKSELQSLKTQIEKLKVLQEQTVNEYYRILDLLVFPSNIKP